MARASGIRLGIHPVPPTLGWLRLLHDPFSASGLVLEHGHTPQNRVAPVGSPFREQSTVANLGRPAGAAGRFGIRIATARARLWPPRPADRRYPRGSQATWQQQPSTAAGPIQTAQAQSGATRSAPQPAPAGAQPTPPAGAGQPQASPPANPPPGANGDSQLNLGASTNDQAIATTPNSVSPYMIGDFFVGSGQIIFVGQSPTGSPSKGIVVGDIPSAGGTARVKISEDNSPIPADRVFFLYNFFQNAIQIPTPDAHNIDVDRYTFGAEKTFLGGLGSVEVRLPFARTQNSDVTIPSNGSDVDTELGNVEAAIKILIKRTEYFALAAGVGLNTPTASNVQFNLPNQETAFTIENNAFHVEPYVGLLVTPSNNFFFQAFIQFDMDTNGNHISEQGVGQIGTLRDQSLMYTDLQAGYWLYRDPQARYFTGFGPMIEFHYTTTLQDAHFVTNPSGEFSFGNVANRLDIHNMTLGAEILLGPMSTLTIAGVVPLDSHIYDRQFDGELFVEFNRFF